MNLSPEDLAEWQSILKACEAGGNSLDDIEEANTFSTQMEQKYGRPFQTLIDTPPPTIRLLNTSCFNRGGRGNSRGTFFAEITNIASTNPGCGACGKALPRKGKTSWFDQPKGIASFWTIRCPACRAPHIIFNRIDAYVAIADSLHPGPPPAVGNGRNEKNQSQLL